MNATLRAGIFYVILVTAPGAAQRPSSAALAARVGDRIRAVPGAEVAVSYRDLATGDSLDVGADVDFHAASTMKIPVMLEVLRAADAGRLGLDQGILLVNRFHSIVDGSPYSLDAADDSDSLMYARVGQRVTVRELMERMIVRSSNLLRQEFNGEIPAGVPTGTPVAHKTGSIAATLHDAAIVYPPGRAPYVLVVLTRKIPSEATARTLIADISRLVWTHATSPSTLGAR